MAERAYMNYFEQIEAMHQQVREYVEQQEPDYKVVSVDGYATSTYMSTLASQGEVLPRQDFILAEVTMRFRVHARYISLTCDVWVLPNGKLHMGDRMVSR